MTSRLAQLVLRRQQLVERSQAQRGDLANSLAPWRGPLALADRGLAGLRFLGRHPAWLMGGLILLARHPALTGKWLQRGWLILHVVQTLRRH